MRMKKLGQAVFGTLIGKLVFWAIALVMLPAIVEELYGLNDLLSAPFKLLSDWQADGALQGRIKFAVLFLLYVSPVALAGSFFISRRSPAPQGAELYHSRNNYEKLIAEVKETVKNRQVPKELKADKIDRLFDALIDDVCNLFQVQRTDVRAVLVVNTSRGRHRLTGWRWGRSCSPDQERMDSKAIDKFLETEVTYPIWQEVKKHFDHTDSDTLLFFRNSGKLELGCLIAIAGPVQVEPHLREWEEIVKPFTMLGHIDKLVRFVVNYN
ncbi:hypothetical protein ACFQZE_21630 [Paenibacillus sp. GCM10027627]|uniref:hypothetical protein n=1 Tax=unclassified Paenibacillus TaxID=185978 RepID=UPI00362509BC